VKQQTTMHRILTILIRMLGRCAQGTALARHKRKQRLAARQGAVSF
jgi:hypothetical protein